MSLLLVLRKPGAVQAGEDAGPSMESARTQGFSNPQRFDWVGGSAWLFPSPGTAGGSGIWVRQGRRFAVACGALHWDGRDGRQALERLLALDLPPGQLPLDEISGAFVLLLGRDDGVWLLGDALGLMKLHEAAGCGVISTSMLACMAALPERRVDRLRAQEYVLLGANHGLGSPIQGLRLLDPCLAHGLSGQVDVPVHQPQRLLPASLPTPAGPAQAVEAVSAAITDEFKALSRVWSVDIGMALSGGFDSRLLLAALDRVGVEPALFVYGGAMDRDVQVARAVARHLGMPLQHVDKDAAEQALPAIDGARLRNNLRFFDGLPIDGIFDRGVDQQTRLMHSANDRLNLNGGGGEILRNFFYLPDRAYSALDLYAAFYSAWLDEVFTTVDERDAFVDHVADEILRSLGRPGGSDAERRRPLARTEVELVYTLFRLRWWMGRNNSLSSRQGAFMTPLVTPALVRLAAGIPIAWKDYGSLEAAVIHRLSPRVAAVPSGYGFAFDQAPPWRHRVQVASTMYRPVAVRHHSLRVQKWLGRVRPPQAPAEWIAALGEEPSGQWLNPAALTSLPQLNRLMTLQALLRHEF